jgi:hypothetical protein
MVSLLTSSVSERSACAPMLCLAALRARRASLTRVALSRASCTAVYVRVCEGPPVRSDGTGMQDDRRGGGARGGESGITGLVGGSSTSSSSLSEGVVRAGMIGASGSRSM